MITEDELRGLIEEAAAAIPPASPLPFDTFRVSPPRVLRLRRPSPAFVGAVAAVFVVGFAVMWVVSLGGSSSSKASSSGPAREPGFDSVANSIGGGTGASAGGTGASTPGDPNALTPDRAVPQAQVPPIADTAKVIKTGSLEVRVGKGTVTESVNRLTAIVTGFGGYVADTKTTASAASDTQATALISVRVPAAAFEQLLAEASKLGEVRATTTSGQDVTAQFTDIDAQLTALSATRDQLLTVLGEAKNVPDILSVQDRITQVQIQIDQLQGQKRLLTDQTSFGTLAVTFLEPGATAAAKPVDDGHDIGDAWRKARQNFGDAVEWIIEMAGTWSVVAIVAAVAWLAYRAVRRRTLTL